MEILFHPIADAENSEAYEWYENQKAGLGKEFEISIEKKLSQIVLNPLRYTKKRGIHREALVETLPYVVVYKFYSKENLIFISSIFHASRNPKKKYRRR